MRFHVHVSIDAAQFAAAVNFYRCLFAQAPTVLKADYAKWMLEQPRVNFAVSTRGLGVGVDHLGIQAEGSGELQVLHDRMPSPIREGETVCCYARSSKSWAHDPAGIAWEAFHTMGEATDYGSGFRSGAQIASPAPPAYEAACCQGELTLPRGIAPRPFLLGYGLAIVVLFGALLWAGV